MFSFIAAMHRVLIGRGKLGYWWFLYCDEAIREWQWQRKV